MNYFERCLPERMGLDSVSLLRFFERAELEDFHIHSFLMLRHGKVIAECYRYPFRPDDGHLVYSVSKTFTSLAVGLAETEGLLNINDKVLKYFPEYAEKDLSPKWKDVTIKNLLCMASGHKQDTTTAVCNSESWLDTFFSQPLEGESGKLFVYNSGGSFVLSEIISRVTNLPMDEYLRPRVFEPMHITDWCWDRKGDTTMGGWGLLIQPEDMAKLGILFLQKGQFEGKQLVPRKWIEDASVKQVETGAEAGDADWRVGYGYQMWMNEKDGFRADGAFGQYVLMYPLKDMIVAVTSENVRSQKILTAVWEELVKTAREESMGVDADICLKLQVMLAQQEKPWHFIPSWSYLEEQISGKHWNLKGIDGELVICLKFCGSRMSMEVSEKQKIISSSVSGLDGETFCRVPPPSLSPLVGREQRERKWKYTAHHQWVSDQILLVTIWYRETGHTQLWEFIFADSEVHLTVRNGCERMLIPNGVVSDRNMEFCCYEYRQQF